MKIREVENIIQDLYDEIDKPKLLGNEEILRCIKVCTDCYKYIKSNIQDKEFETQKEEIYFFKHVKPKVTSKYFYYLKLYQIETSVPIASTDVKIRYYKDQIKKLDNYTANHKEFCAYIQRNATYMDHVYFTRGNKSPELFTNYQFIEIGHEFATSHGFVLARILANDKLHMYLSRKIQVLENNYSELVNLLSPVKWKGSKTNLVVMMYGLVETNQVDCDLATLTTHMQKVFDIELKEIYRIWADVRSRKKEKFPWMKEMLRRLEDRAKEE